MCNSKFKTTVVWAWLEANSRNFSFFILSSQYFVMSLILCHLGDSTQKKKNYGSIIFSWTGRWCSCLFTDRHIFSQALFCSLGFFCSYHNLAQFKVTFSNYFKVDIWWFKSDQVLPCIWDWEANLCVMDACWWFICVNKTEIFAGRPRNGTVYLAQVTI